MGTSRKRAQNLLFMLQEQVKIAQVNFIFGHRLY